MDNNTNNNNNNNNNKAAKNVADTVTVKARFNDDQRRFQFEPVHDDPDQAFTNLLAHVAGVFDLDQALTCLHNDGSATALDPTLFAAACAEHIEAGTPLRLTVTSMPCPLANTEQSADTQPGFDTLLHVESGARFPVSGLWLPQGTLCFSLAGKTKNVAIGPKGGLHHQGGQGPWAQFVPLPADTAPGHIHLASKGNFAKGWGLGCHPSSGTLCMAPEPRGHTWLVERAGAGLKPPGASAWWLKKKTKGYLAAVEPSPTEEEGKSLHTVTLAKRQWLDQVEKKLAEAAEWYAAHGAALPASTQVAMEAWKVDLLSQAAQCKEWLARHDAVTGPEEPPLRELYTISLAGTVDTNREAVGVGSYLAAHRSHPRDVLDPNGTFVMVTDEAAKASLWSIEEAPQGLVELRIRGNLDGRTTAQDWSLMVSADGREPHKRDPASNYLIVTRTGPSKNAGKSAGKKGGLWAVVPCPSDPARCLLQYQGNRDGRPAGVGRYLAVHGSNPRDHRDEHSWYAIVTAQADKASKWEIRRFFGAVPPPPPSPKAPELDADGNPKLGFHATKKAAFEGLRRAWAALRDAGEEPGAELTPKTAAAALTSLRVACQWLRKKTGLPIVIEECSNDEALVACNKLCALPMSLPKWLSRTASDPAHLQPLLHSGLAALAAPVVELWRGERVALPVARDPPVTELAVADAKQQAKQEAKEAKQQAKEQAKEAKQYAKQQAKEAKQYAKEQANEAKQQAKQQAKEAKQQAKEAKQQAKQQGTMDSDTLPREPPETIQEAIAVLGLEEVDLTSSLIHGIVAALDDNPEPEAPAADEAGPPEQLPDGDLVVTPEEPEWDAMLEELVEMGFTDRAANRAHLAEAHGDVKQAVKGLVAEERREGCQDAA